MRDAIGANGEVEQGAAGVVMEETVTIAREDYEVLLRDSAKLYALENAGVDNWDGYEDAVELLAYRRAPSFVIGEEHE